MTLPKEHLQVGAHFIVTSVFMSCWLGGLDRFATVAIAVLTGTVFHTIADTAVHPERGGDRLVGTTISNMLFTTVLMGAFSFMLPPL